MPESLPEKFSIALHRLSKLFNVAGHGNTLA